MGSCYARILTRYYDYVLHSGLCTLVREHYRKSLYLVRGDRTVVTRTVVTRTVVTRTVVTWTVVTPFL